MALANSPHQAGKRAANPPDSTGSFHNKENGHKHYRETHTEFDKINQDYSVLTAGNPQKNSTNDTNAYEKTHGKFWGPASKLGITGSKNETIAPPAVIIRHNGTAIYEKIVEKIFHFSPEIASEEIDRGPSEKLMPTKPKLKPLPTVFEKPVPTVTVQTTTHVKPVSTVKKPPISQAKPEPTEKNHAPPHEKPVPTVKVKTHIPADHGQDSAKVSSGKEPPELIPEEYEYEYEQEHAKAPKKQIKHRYTAIGKKTPTLHVIPEEYEYEYEQNEAKVPKKQMKHKYPAIRKEPPKLIPKEYEYEYEQENAKVPKKQRKHKYPAIRKEPPKIIPKEYEYEYEQENVKVPKKQRKHKYPAIGKEPPELIPEEYEDEDEQTIAKVPKKQWKHKYPAIGKEPPELIPEEYEFEYDQENERVPKKQIKQKYPAIGKEPPELIPEEYEDEDEQTIAKVPKKQRKHKYPAIGKEPPKLIPEEYEFEYDQENERVPKKQIKHKYPAIGKEPPELNPEEYEFEYDQENERVPKKQIKHKYPALGNEPPELIPEEYEDEDEQKMAKVPKKQIKPKYPVIGKEPPQLIPEEYEDEDEQTIAKVPKKQIKHKYPVIGKEPIKLIPEEYKFEYEQESEKVPKKQREHKYPAIGKEPLEVIPEEYEYEYEQKNRIVPEKQMKHKYLAFGKGPPKLILEDYEYEYEQENEEVPKKQRKDKYPAIGKEPPELIPEEYEDEDEQKMAKVPKKQIKHKYPAIGKESTKLIPEEYKFEYEQENKKVPKEQRKHQYPAIEKEPLELIPKEYEDEDEQKMAKVPKKQIKHKYPAIGKESTKLIPEEYKFEYKQENKKVPKEQRKHQYPAIGKEPPELIPDEYEIEQDNVEYPDNLLPNGENGEIKYGEEPRSKSHVKPVPTEKTHLISHVKPVPTEKTHIISHVKPVPTEKMSVPVPTQQKHIISQVQPVPTEKKHIILHVTPLPTKNTHIVSHVKPVPTEKTRIVSHIKPVSTEEKHKISHVKPVPTAKKLMPVQTEQKHIISQVKPVPTEKTHKATHVTPVPTEKKHKVTQAKQAPTEKKIVTHEKPVPTEKKHIMLPVNPPSTERTRIISHVLNPVSTKTSVNISHVKPVPTEKTHIISHVQQVPTEKTQIISHVKPVPTEKTRIISHVKPVTTMKTHIISYVKPVPTEKKLIISHTKPVPPEKKQTILHEKPEPTEKMQITSHVKPVSIVTTSTYVSNLRPVSTVQTHVIQLVKPVPTMAAKESECTPDPDDEEIETTEESNIKPMPTVKSAISIVEPGPCETKHIISNVKAVPTDKLISISDANTRTQPHVKLVPIVKSHKISNVKPLPTVVTHTKSNVKPLLTTKMHQILDVDVLGDQGLKKNTEEEFDYAGVESDTNTSPPLPETTSEFDERPLSGFLHTLKNIFAFGRESQGKSTPLKYLSEWGKWSACNGTCATKGTRRRTRVCLNQKREHCVGMTPDVTFEQEACRKKNCDELGLSLISCDTKPCLNGGVCKDIPSLSNPNVKFKCKCPVGVSGKLCEYDYRVPLTAGTSVTSALVLLVLIIIICLCRKRHKASKQDKGSGHGGPRKSQIIESSTKFSFSSLSDVGSDSNSEHESFRLSKSGEGLDRQEAESNRDLYEQGRHYSSRSTVGLVPVELSKDKSDVPRESHSSKSTGRPIPMEPSQTWPNVSTRNEHSMKKFYSDSDRPRGEGDGAAAEPADSPSGSSWNSEISYERPFNETDPSRTSGRRLKADTCSWSSSDSLAVAQEHAGQSHPGNCVALHPNSATKHSPADQVGSNLTEEDIGKSQIFISSSLTKSTHSNATYVSNVASKKYDISSHESSGVLASDQRSDSSKSLKHVSSNRILSSERSSKESNVSSRKLSGRERRSVLGINRSRIALRRKGKEEYGSEIDNIDLPLGIRLASMRDLNALPPGVKIAPMKDLNRVKPQESSSSNGQDIYDIFPSVKLSPMKNSSSEQPSVGSSSDAHDEDRHALPQSMARTSVKAFPSKQRPETSSRDAQNMDIRDLPNGVRRSTIGALPRKPCPESSSADDLDMDIRDLSSGVRLAPMKNSMRRQIQEASSTDEYDMDIPPDMRRSTMEDLNSNQQPESSSSDEQAIDLHDLLPSVKLHVAPGKDFPRQQPSDSSSRDAHDMDRNDLPPNKPSTVEDLTMNQLLRKDSSVVHEMDRQHLPQGVKLSLTKQKPLESLSSIGREIDVHDLAPGTRRSTTEDLNRKQPPETCTSVGHELNMPDTPPVMRRTTAEDLVRKQLHESCPSVGHEMYVQDLPSSIRRATIEDLTKKQSPAISCSVGHETDVRDLDTGIRRATMDDLARTQPPEISSSVGDEMHDHDLPSDMRRATVEDLTTKRSPESSPSVGRKMGVLEVAPNTRRATTEDLTRRKRPEIIASVRHDMHDHDLPSVMRRDRIEDLNGKQHSESSFSVGREIIGRDLDPGVGYEATTEDLTRKQPPEISSSVGQEMHQHDIPSGMRRARIEDLNRNQPSESSANVETEADVDQLSPGISRVTMGDRKQQLESIASVGHDMGLHDLPPGTSQATRDDLSRKQRPESSSTVRHDTGMHEISPGVMRRATMEDITKKQQTASFNNVENKQDVHDFPAGMRRATMKGLTRKQSPESSSRVELEMEVHGISPGMKRATMEDTSKTQLPGNSFTAGRKMDVRDLPSGIIIRDTKENLNRKQPPESCTSTGIGREMDVHDLPPAMNRTSVEDLTRKQPSTSSSGVGREIDIHDRTPCVSRAKIEGCPSVGREFDVHELPSGMSQTTIGDFPEKQRQESSYSVGHDMDMQDILPGISRARIEDLSRKQSPGSRSSVKHEMVTDNQSPRLRRAAMQDFYGKQAPESCTSVGREMDVDDLPSDKRRITVEDSTGKQPPQIISCVPHDMDISPAAMKNLLVTKRQPRESSSSEFGREIHMHNRPPGVSRAKIEDLTRKQPPESYLSVGSKFDVHDLPPGMSRTSIEDLTRNKTPKSNSNVGQEINMHEQHPGMSQAAMEDLTRKQPPESSSCVRHEMGPSDLRRATMEDLTRKQRPGSSSRVLHDPPPPGINRAKIEDLSRKQPPESRSSVRHEMDAYNLPPGMRRVGVEDFTRTQTPESLSDVMNEVDMYDLRPRMMRTTMEDLNIKQPPESMNLTRKQLPDGSASLGHGSDTHDLTQREMQASVISEHRRNFPRDRLDKVDYLIDDLPLDLRQSKFKDINGSPSAKRVMKKDLSDGTNSMPSVSRVAPDLTSKHTSEKTSNLSKYEQYFARRGLEEDDEFLETEAMFQQDTVSPCSKTDEILGLIPPTPSTQSLSVHKEDIHNESGHIYLAHTRSDDALMADSNVMKNSGFNRKSNLGTTSPWNVNNSPSAGMAFNPASLQDSSNDSSNFDCLLGKRKSCSVLDDSDTVLIEPENKDWPIFQSTPKKRSSCSQIPPFTGDRCLEASKQRSLGEFYSSTASDTSKLRATTSEFTLGFRSSAGSESDHHRRQSCSRVRSVVSGDDSIIEIDEDAVSELCSSWIEEEEEEAVARRWQYGIFSGGTLPVPLPLPGEENGAGTNSGRESQEISRPKEYPSEENQEPQINNRILEDFGDTQLDSPRTRNRRNVSPVREFAHRFPEAQLKIHHHGGKFSALTKEFNAELLPSPEIMRMRNSPMDTTMPNTGIDEFELGINDFTPSNSGHQRSSYDTSTTPHAADQDARLGQSSLQHQWERQSGHEATQGVTQRKDFGFPCQQNRQDDRRGPTQRHPFPTSDVYDRYERRGDREQYPVNRFPKGQDRHEDRRGAAQRQPFPTFENRDWHECRKVPEQHQPLPSRIEYDRHEVRRGTEQHQSVPSSNDHEERSDSAQRNAFRYENKHDRNENGGDQEQRHVFRLPSEQSRKEDRSGPLQRQSLPNSYEYDIYKQSEAFHRSNENYMHEDRNCPERPQDRQEHNAYPTSNEHYMHEDRKSTERCQHRQAHNAYPASNERYMHEDRKGSERRQDRQEHIAYPTSNEHYMHEDRKGTERRQDRQEHIAYPTSNEHYMHEDRKGTERRQDRQEHNAYPTTDENFMHEDRKGTERRQDRQEHIAYPTSNEQYMHEDRKGTELRQDRQEHNVHPTSNEQYMHEDRKGTERRQDRQEHNAYPSSDENYMHEHRRQDRQAHIAYPTSDEHYMHEERKGTERRQSVLTSDGHDDGGVLVQGNASSSSIIHEKYENTRGQELRRPFFTSNGDCETRCPQQQQAFSSSNKYDKQASRRNSVQRQAFPISNERDGHEIRRDRERRPVFLTSNERDRHESSGNQPHHQLFPTSNEHCRYEVRGGLAQHEAFSPSNRHGGPQAQRQVSPSNKQIGNVSSIPADLDAQLLPSPEIMRKPDSPKDMLRPRADEFQWEIKEYAPVISDGQRSACMMSPLAHASLTKDEVSSNECQHGHVDDVPTMGSEDKPKSLEQNRMSNYGNVRSSSLLQTGMAEIDVSANLPSYSAGNWSDVDDDNLGECDQNTVHTKHVIHSQRGNVAQMEGMSSQKNIDKPKDDMKHLWECHDAWQDRTNESSREISAEISRCDSTDWLTESSSSSDHGSPKPRQEMIPKLRSVRSRINFFDGIPNEPTKIKSENAFETLYYDHEHTPIKCALCKDKNLSEDINAQSNPLSKTPRTDAGSQRTSTLNYGSCIKHGIFDISEGNTSVESPETSCVKPAPTEKAKVDTSFFESLGLPDSNLKEITRGPKKVPGAVADANWMSLLRSNLEKRRQTINPTDSSTKLIGQRHQQGLRLKNHRKVTLTHKSSTKKGLETGGGSRREKRFSISRNALDESPLFRQRRAMLNEAPQNHNMQSVRSPVRKLTDSIRSRFTSFMGGVFKSSGSEKQERKEERGTSTQQQPISDSEKQALNRARKGSAQRQTFSSSNEHTRNGYRERRGQVERQTFCTSNEALHPPNEHGRMQVKRGLKQSHGLQTSNEHDMQQARRGSTQPNKDFSSSSKHDRNNDSRRPSQQWDLGTLNGHGYRQEARRCSAQSRVIPTLYEEDGYEAIRGTEQRKAIPISHWHNSMRGIDMQQASNQRTSNGVLLKNMKIVPRCLREQPSRYLAKSRTSESECERLDRSSNESNSISEIYPNMAPNVNRDPAQHINATYAKSRSPFKSQRETNRAGSPPSNESRYTSMSQVSNNVRKPSCGYSSNNSSVSNFYASPNSSVQNIERATKGSSSQHNKTMTTIKTEERKIQNRGSGFYPGNKESTIWPGTRHHSGSRNMLRAEERTSSQPTLEDTCLHSSIQRSNVSEQGRSSIKTILTQTKEGAMGVISAVACRLGLDVYSNVSLTKHRSNDTTVFEKSNEASNRSSHNSSEIIHRNSEPLNDVNSNYFLVSERSGKVSDMSSRKHSGGERFSESSNNISRMAWRPNGHEKYDCAERTNLPPGVRIAPMKDLARRRPPERSSSILENKRDFQKRRVNQGAEFTRKVAPYTEVTIEAYLDSESNDNSISLQSNESHVSTCSFPASKTDWFSPGVSPVSTDSESMDVTFDSASPTISMQSERTESFDEDGKDERGLPVTDTSGRLGQVSGIQWHFGMNTKSLSSPCVRSSSSTQTPSRAQYKAKFRRDE